MGLSLTPRAFQRIFPHASKSTFAANFGAGANPRDYAPGVSNAEPEFQPIQALDGSLPGEEKGPQRARVRIKRYGYRILDADNATGGCKPLIDCLKEAGLIENDSPEYIDLEVVQQLVMRREEERTEIQITYL